MASFSVSGFEDLAKTLKNIGEMDNGELKEKMLEAGANETREVWQEEITARGYIRTGEMLKKVKSTKTKSQDSSSYREVYPQGTVTRGGKKKIKTRNAEKAYILHYGTKKIKGSRFVDDIERKASTRVHDVMQKELNNYIDKNN